MADPTTSSAQGALADEPFPAGWSEKWATAYSRIAHAGYGEAVSEAYRRDGPVLAGKVGPVVAIRLGMSVSDAAIRSGRFAASLLPKAAVAAADRLRDGARVVAWLDIVDRVAKVAPESLAALLERTPILLAALDLRGFEAFVGQGLNVSRRDPSRRLAFFKLEAAEALAFLDAEHSGVTYTAMKGRLIHYLAAIWNLHPPFHNGLRSEGQGLLRRATFAGGVIQLPAGFAGYPTAESRQLYYAAVAHIGAHYRFTRAPFATGQLKPLQVAVISLIEDARVEWLAQREMPGLHALWRRFHVATPTGTPTSITLMARLARALLDSDYADPDGWVAKGRALFQEALLANAEDPSLSRRIGGTLGNDLGQMRLQFDARTYVVQPAYRDDNLGLWESADQADATQDMAQMIEAARLRRTDDQGNATLNSEQAAGRTAREAEAKAEERNGIPVARYPEFDYLTGREQADWCTVKEYLPDLQWASKFDRSDMQHDDLVGRLKALLRSSKVSRHQRIRRQLEGEFLDADGCIEAMISKRIGLAADPRVYCRFGRRGRDLSVLLLLDTSQSTSERVGSSGQSVLELEQLATAGLAQAMDELSDPFAIAAFCSDTREDVRYTRVKDFTQAYDPFVAARLAALTSGRSTRLGAAMRHAAVDLRRQRTYRRLLLVITDGEPSDVDVEDRKYLVEDARTVVHGLAAEDIDTFCVALDSDAESYATYIFGRRNAVPIGAIEQLPERLPALYVRLKG